MMMRLHYYAEWLYYGFWYWVAWYTLDLPRWLIHGDARLRQPFIWIVQQGLVFSYLPTIEERKAMSCNEEFNGERSDSAATQGSASDGPEKGSANE